MRSAASILLGLGVCVAVTARSGHAQEVADRQQGTHGTKTVYASRTELPIVVDGDLNDPAWADAAVSLGFLQKGPEEGQPSSERTEFRVLHTNTTLYVGVICYDQDAGGIRATERRRDADFENDDTLSLILDTFHDHRNSYLLRTNPLGAQYDALVTDEGKSTNSNWDETWEVASRITAAGWVVEFGIPFKSLRVSEEDQWFWGLDVERVIRRKNEFSYWNGYQRGFDFEQVSQAGHLGGWRRSRAGCGCGSNRIGWEGSASRCDRRPRGWTRFGARSGTPRMQESKC